MDFLKSYIPNVHKEGIYFIVIALILAALSSLISSSLTIILVLACIFMVFFFRDPVRITPVGENLIVSPADGVITKIEEAELPKTLGFEAGRKVTRISIFLSVFDVHVNRVPADGKIQNMYYHKGQFLNAALDKASEVNERQEISMTMKDGSEIAFTQIAGFIARRIICHAQEAQEVRAGERYGIIRFGSRMDVYLPKNVSPAVFVGQRVIGGETILANTKLPKGMLGEIR